MQHRLRGAGAALQEGWSEAEVCAEKLPLRGGLCAECPGGSHCGSIGKKSSIKKKITIGKNSNIQDNAVIHGDHGNDVTVGENVTVGHGAILHGCTVEDNALIGMGSVVLDHAVIGAGSIVGAGAVVSSGTIVPPKSLVVGIPAKVKKTLTDEESAGNLENVEEYLGLMVQAMADPENQ